MQIQTQKKLNYLDETRGLIREAIEAKGQTVADSDTFRSYADKINAIETKADPVVAPLEVTENGTYTAPDGVDGYSPVTVNIDPTKITILKEEEVTGFAMDDDFGYAKTETPTYTIEEGEKYFVTWDGVTYETTAMDASAVIPGALFMGNGTMLGLPGNNEPFAIGFISGQVVYVAFTDPAESHTIGIQKSAIKEIKLQDKTITENGEYTADAGFDGLGKVLVEIASGGGGGSLVCKTGQFTASAAKQTIQHNLGVVPSVFLVRNKYGSTGTDYELWFAYGVNQTFAAKLGITTDQQLELYTYSNSPRQGTPDYPIDTTVTGFSSLSNANANTIDIGYSSAKLVSKEIYTWIAIGETE